MGADGGLDSLERYLRGRNGRHFGTGRGFRIFNKSDRACVCGYRGGYRDRRVAVQKLGHRERKGVTVGRLDRRGI